MNRSDAGALHPVEKDPAIQSALYQPKSTEDYGTKLGVQYEPPPVVREFPKKHSFVHNQVANKAKTNNEHLETIINSRVLNPRKAKILRQLHETGVEFRAMTSFKNALFDSEKLGDNHLLPVEEWDRIRVRAGNAAIDAVAPLILEEIKHKESNLVNLQKFMDLLDLFTLLPMTKTVVKN